MSADTPAATPEPSETAPADVPPLERLLALQDLDTAVSQLQHRRAGLPERKELAGVAAARGALEGRMAAVRAERTELAQRQGELEQQIATATARLETLEQRLYAARGAPARDLQAMDEEIRHLRHRRGELEDAELEVMVGAEPLDAGLEAMAAEQARLDGQAAALAAAIEEAEAAIDAELGERTGARADVAARVGAELLGRYEALRARLGGTGAARLVGNRCGGCHLELPAMEVDRIRRLPPGTVVTCDQCGRILVPGAAPG